MSDRELFALFERSPIGMYRTLRDGSLLFANSALVRMLEYPSRAELLRANMARDVWADAAERSALIERCEAAGLVDGAEARWRTRTGREIIVQLYGHVQRDADGNECFDGTVTDITIARQQRDELERTARTLELVVQQVPAMYWLVDHDLRILTAGGAIERVLGYQPTRWLGSTLYDVYGVEPDSGDGGIIAHRRALAGETITYPSEYRSKQLSTTVAPYVRDGQIAGVIGTSIDITTATMLERRMIDAQRAESLGVLAGGLAHDFNNLLVAILGNADLGLRDVPATAPGRTSLENIRNAALRAAELTDQLLAYAGRGAVSTSRVAPRDVVDELLRITAATMPANVVVDVTIPAELAIRADAAQIRQTLMNFLANARDALGEAGGHITVTGRNVQHDGAPHVDDVVTAPAGAYVELAVADDGPGFDRDTRRRIFEPFFTTKPTGHGLGLAAVLGIVRAHAGGLRVHSIVGHGARFSVLWPATFTPQQQPVAVPVPDALTVLVIDDEDLVRDVVARMIEDLGYAAVTASDGLIGLEIVERQRIDCVLVDLTMPRMNGSDVVAALRKKHPGLPVILCTGFDLHRRGPVQADAYLPKPFRIDALEQTLARLLRPS